MTEFDTYLSRHGEDALQAIVERIERYDGIRHTIVLPLHTRWNALFQNTPAQALAA